MGLRPGERLGLIGETGSGKSTLMRALARLDPMVTGEVRWRGKPVLGDDVPAFRRQVVYVGQRPALIAGSVVDALRLPFSFASRSTGFDASLARCWLDDLCGDTTLWDRESETLSGGEQQLVALVRAVLVDPCILMLDEPTSSLDASTAQRCEQRVLRWLDERPERAVIWTSHDRTQVDRLASRTVQMRGGVLSPGGD